MPDNSTMHAILDAPNLGQLEKEALVRCIDSNYVSTFGPFVSEFEDKLSKFVGARTAIAVQSGTDGLYLALLMSGVAPGDEVIVPVITFVASANPVMRLGATPVFVDVNPETWNMDLSAVERAITNRTKVIIPVHLYGNPCDMDKLLALAHHHGCSVIEDATESLGACIGNTMTGVLGRFGVYSFNGNKTITTGGGGVIIPASPDEESQLRHLINQARDVSKGYYHTDIGYNLSMTNLEASLGLAQLDRLSGFLQKKRRYAQIYREGFEGIEAITVQQETSNAQSSWWLTSVTVDSDRDIADIQAELLDKGVPTRRLFRPIVDFPPYRQRDTEDYPHARRLYAKGLSLPSSTLNSERNIEHTVTTLIEAVNRTGRSLRRPTG